MISRIPATNCSMSWRHGTRLIRCMSTIAGKSAQRTKAGNSAKLSTHFAETFNLGLRHVFETARSGFDEMIPDGVPDQFGNGVQIQLGHDVRAMLFHSLDGDLQCSGNFFVGSAFRDELHDLAFARTD